VFQYFHSEVASAGPFLGALISAFGGKRINIAPTFEVEAAPESQTAFAAWANQLEDSRRVTLGA
jgi:hypothetical protein